MQLNLKNKNFDYRFLILLLNMLVLSGSVILNKYIIALIGIIVWILFYTTNKSMRDIIIARMLILSIPLSFTNIFGGPYGESTISWYNIFLLLLIISVFLKGKLYFNLISLLSIFIIIISLIPMLIPIDVFDSFKQYANFLSNFILIIIGNNLLSDSEQNYKRKLLISDYIYTTKIAALGVIIQIFFINVLNINIGNYKFLGGYRHSYGFLFSDFSFLSLYIVSGAILIWLKTDKQNFNFKDFAEILLLLLSSIMTSARTGIFSFLFVLVLFSMKKSLVYANRGSIRSIVLVLANLLIVLVSYFLLDKVRGQFKFSDSGRMELNKLALHIFLENPLFGVGLGGSNYTGMLPHNILFQYLVQGGLILTIPLFLFFLLVIYITFKKDKIIFAGILCILIGSFFVPNIFDSRFLGAILMVMNTRSRSVNAKY